MTEQENAILRSQLAQMQYKLEENEQALSVTLEFIKKSSYVGQYNKFLHKKMNTCSPYMISFQTYKDIINRIGSI